MICIFKKIPFVYTKRTRLYIQMKPNLKAKMLIYKVVTKILYIQMELVCIYKANPFVYIKVVKMSLKARMLGLVPMRLIAVKMRELVRLTN